MKPCWPVTSPTPCKCLSDHAVIRPTGPQQTTKGDLLAGTSPNSRFQHNSAFPRSQLSYILQGVLDVFPQSQTAGNQTPHFPNPPYLGCTLSHGQGYFCKTNSGVYFLADTLGNTTVTRASLEQTHLVSARRWAMYITHSLISHVQQPAGNHTSPVLEETGTVRRLCQSYTASSGRAEVQTRKGGRSLHDLGHGPLPLALPHSNTYPLCAPSGEKQGK